MLRSVIVDKLLDDDHDYNGQVTRETHECDHNKNANEPFIFSQSRFICDLLGKNRAIEVEAFENSRIAVHHDNERNEIANKDNKNRKDRKKLWRFAIS